uniref:Uncharacterized protein n=1 Tax=Romanomermis culicivorax TaxID=13658 RepID=A0A915IVJ6_ROMCU
MQIMGLSFKVQSQAQYLAFCEDRRETAFTFACLFFLKFLRIMKVERNQCGASHIGAGHFGAGHFGAS